MPLKTTGEDGEKVQEVTAGLPDQRGCCSSGIFIRTRWQFYKELKAFPGGKDVFGIGCVHTRSDGAQPCRLSAQRLIWCESSLSSARLWHGQFAAY